MGSVLNAPKNYILKSTFTRNKVPRHNQKLQLAGKAAYPVRINKFSVYRGEIFSENDFRKVRIIWRDF